MEVMFIQESTGDDLREAIADFLESEKIKKEHLVSISYATESGWSGGYKHNAIIVFEK